MLHKIIIQTIGVLFLLGGIVHWLIIFGVIKEATPVLITIYFHSLAIFSPLAGIGLCFIKEWGRKLGLLIALTQLPAHGYMLYLDSYANWNSGVAPWERGLDMAFAIFYLIYFQFSAIKTRFKARMD
ncbi:MAG: hypothetical protein JRD93_06015 [Deltaproteobacteria bacterium]|nr:hypothetical protein [Deltaproteobacteria bacterium]